MNKLVAVLSALACCLWVQAQVYLLPDFELSVATGKHGNRPIQERFNYNCVTRTMEFLDNENILKLDPISQIDTLYLGNHKMIPYGTCFLDVVYISPEFSMLVDYKRRVVNKGKVGAMGLKTQSSVENVDFSAIGGRHTEDWKKGIDVWECKDESTYVYIVKGKMKRFRNKKTLIKIFPDKVQQINQYIDEKKISFDNVGVVLDLLKFLTGN